MTADQMIVVSGELDLPSVYDFVLETAVKERKLDMQDVVNAARALVEQCRLMWSDNLQALKWRAAIGKIWYNGDVFGKGRRRNGGRNETREEKGVR